MSKIFGITGGIASGKSYISEIIRNKDFKVFDADEIAHQVGDSPEIIKKISEIFGEEVIDKNKIDRFKLGEIVFNDKSKLNLLNSIMGPTIKKKIVKLIDRYHKENSERIYFMEIPLLFEQNYEKYFDGTILVYVDNQTQIQRLMKRDNIEKEFAEKKINSQMSLDEKKDKSDYIINNSNSEIENINDQVNKLLHELKK
ncbi:dephospho-CoA kinase [Companilactobacillus sp. DQM5]|uniref:dephospho-CoA kinase n=1 Tax=Companilactobacillus sp. DQM5 TaxID=3463359 RepID=UPI004059EF70